MTHTLAMSRHHPMTVQGEPEFDRLKRELEEVKNQPRGLEGTFRTAAEMDRHRAQLADAAIEEQLEVQTAFREHGARLQVPCHSPAAVLVKAMCKAKLVLLCCAVCQTLFELCLVSEIVTSGIFETVDVRP